MLEKILETKGVRNTAFWNEVSAQLSSQEFQETTVQVLGDALDFDTL